MHKLQDVHAISFVRKKLLQSQNFKLQAFNSGLLARALPSLHGFSNQPVDS